MYVDLLNYGTAAQQKLGYALDRLANARVTAEQQAQYASPAQPQVNNQKVEGVEPYIIGAELGNQLTMNVYYAKAQIATATSATIRFTNNHGDEINRTIEELTGPSAALVLIKVDDMVIADCEQMITITLYDAEGNVVSSVEDSIGSWVARDTSGDAIYSAIMKLSYSARRYFNK